MKDYYDLYKLSEFFELEQIILLEAIKATFERRETSITTEELSLVLNNNSLEKAFQRYCKKMDLKTIEFNDITSRLKTLFIPIFELIEENTRKNEKSWNFHIFQWE